MTKVSELPPSDPENIKEYVRGFAKRMLKSQLFLGHYIEKRYVEQLNSYRDVVKVDSNEKEFIDNLLVVKRRIIRDVHNVSWIGIMEPNVPGVPFGYTLWITLPVQVFGMYWFKVKTVEFVGNEIRLKLEVVREVRDEKVGHSEPESDNIQDLKTTLHNVSGEVNNFINEQFTWTNIKHTIVFIFLLMGTLIGAGINGIKYVLDFKLKFMRELSIVIKSITPFALAVINLIGKTIFGLYQLIFAVTRPKPQPQFVFHPDQSRMIRGPRYQPRAIGYGSNSKSSVTITELNDDDY